MVSDSNAVDAELRRYSVRKVFRIHGHLIGFAGHMPEFERFCEWYRGRMLGKLRFNTDKSTALILAPVGLFVFDDNATGLQRVVKGREAIGSGAMCAIAAFEALDWQDPTKAVRIACNHDAQSGGPVKTYKLRGPAA